MDDAKRGAASPWHFPVAVEDVPELGEHFDLTADSQVRAAIAKAAGLRDLTRLEANFDVNRQRGGLRVIGRIAATVGQTCVVTLEPVANEVAEDVDLLFAPQASVAESGGAAIRPEGSKYDVEPLIGEVVDLGALATEFLVLGLDPYPRKPGAVFESPEETAAGDGPFSALAALQKGRDAD
ncbi:MAG: DUF177 domain-containing protein [Xanthobacteraceae bacterium]|jgi:hypothetical protein